jgi:uncharacterized membrane protein
MFAGVLIRQFFVLRHINQQKIWLPAVAIGLLALTFIWLMPKLSSSNEHASRVPFQQVQSIIGQRCVVCHAVQPTQPGFVQPPKGVILETGEQIKQHAAMIRQTVQTRYMPIGNLTAMTDDERQTVANWVGQGASITD